MAGTTTFAEIIDGDVFKYYADGEWKNSSSGKYVPIINPTTRKTQFKVQACTQEEIHMIMESATIAQISWDKTPLWERAKLLHKAAAILKEHKAPIAECLVKEIAKPAKDAVDEVVRSGDLVSYCAEEGVRILEKAKVSLSDSSKRCFKERVPLGVVLAIPPFNYPVNLAVSKIGLALITGNSIVLKPPIQGAVAVLHMVHCFHLAGFPNGVISCVTGNSHEISDFLTLHPKLNCIRCVSNGGLDILTVMSIFKSTEYVLNLIARGGDTGVVISKKSRMISCKMEQGGKVACIVLEDADLDLAAEDIVKGGFSYSGQRCTAVKVVLVMESIADALVEKVNAKVAKLSVGLPEDNCDITPIVTESSANFIGVLVMDAKHKGATLCQEYRREGNLIWPLLLDHVRLDMRIAWEEPFGPVVPIVRMSSVGEGVNYCNSINSDLQVTVFSGDTDRVMMMADAMEIKLIRINPEAGCGLDHFLFQGLKEYDFDPQGIMSSIEMVTNIRTIIIYLKQSRAM